MAKPSASSAAPAPAPAKPKPKAKAAPAPAKKTAPPSSKPPKAKAKASAPTPPPEPPPAKKAKAKAAPSSEPTATPAAPSPPRDPGHSRHAIETVAERFKLISDPTRLRIVSILGLGESNVTDLCTLCDDQSQPALSHHLSIMRHSKIVSFRRDGKHNIYGLTDHGKELATLAHPLIAAAARG